MTDFSGTSILSNEFVVKGSAPNVAHVATGGKTWLKKPKSEQNDLELVSFLWNRLNEFIILVWSNVKNE